MPDDAQAISEAPLSGAAATLQAELDALASTGGTLVVPPGLPYTLDGLVTVPAGVNLRGAGNGKLGLLGTRFVCSTADAGIAFGELGEGTRGGQSGDFIIDGDDVADVGLHIGRAVQRTFANIDVIGCVDANLLVQEGQNNLFLACNFEDCAGDGIRLDRGAGGNAFFRCESNANGRYNVCFVQTEATSSPLYARPSHNGFYHCVIERRTSSTSAQVHSEEGNYNVFYSCVITAWTATEAGTLVSVPAPASSINAVEFSSCTILGNDTYVTGITAGNGATVQLTGTTRMIGLLNGLSIATGATIDVQGHISRSAVTNLYAGAGAHDAYIRQRLLNPIEVTRPASTDSILLGLMSGDTNPRFRVQAAGALGWGPGNATYDVNLFRQAADVLRTQDEFVADLGMRIGSATGPRWRTGTGSPEGVMTAPVGSLYSRTDGGAGTSLYVKESGTGSTGWRAV